MSSLREFYNEKYANEEWSALTLKPDAISTNAYDDVIRLLQSSSVGKSILEVGCGSGRLAVALAEKGFSVTGCDLSDTRIELAKHVVAKSYKHLDHLLEFHSGDVGDAQIGSNEVYDVVVLCAVIEHVIDPFVLLRDCIKRLKPGGHIVVSTPNAGYIKHIFALLRGRVPLTGSPVRDMKYWEQHGWDGAHFHYFTKLDLGDLLNHVGCTPLKWTSDGKYAKFRRWSSLLSGDLNVIATVR